jgi:integrase
LCNEYLEAQKSRIKHSSYKAIESRLKTHIMPSFAGVKVKDLTALQVLRWQNSLENSYKYNVVLRSTLASVLKFGEKYYDLPNVMPKVDSIKRLVRKKEMQFWTSEEFLRANACVGNHIYRLFLGFLYYSGCRLGEGQAITWEDLDMDTGEVTINKTVTRKTSNGQAWEVTLPKTESSIRKLTLPHKYFKELRLERLNRADEPSHYFVFGGERPLPPTSVEREHKKAIAAAGVKPIRIHDLRHSHASALISSGATIVTVSRRLGHSNTEQTLNTYAHMFPKDEKEIVEKTNKFV